MRIVSLLPSTTEILFAIGAGDDVVGVTFECDHPAEARERTHRLDHRHARGPVRPRDRRLRGRRRWRAGEDLYHLDEGALGALDADLVVTQDLCAVCAVDVSVVDDALAHLGCRAEVLTIDPHTLDEVLESVVTLGAATGCEAPTRPSSSPASRERLDAVGAGRARTRPDRGCWCWSGPTRRSRPGHWVPEMVTAGRRRQRASATPARSRCGSPGTRSRDSAPEVVVCAPVRLRPRGVGRAWPQGDRRRRAAARHTGLGGGRQRVLRAPRAPPRRRRRGAGRHPAPGRGAAAAPGDGATAAVRPEAWSRRLSRRGR